MNQFIFLIAVFGVLLNAAAQLAIKWGVTKINDLATDKGIFFVVHSVIINPGILIGLSLYALSVVVWMYVLSKLEVSVAYPLLSIGYVVNLFLAAWLFDEPVTTYKLIGIGLILLGVIILYKGSNT
jgi:multidrug transporter EmrE-like cation transporter